MESNVPGKKLHFALILCILLGIGFLTTSFVSFYVARDSLQEQIAESTLPLTSDNIYSEIQRDLLQPIFISSLMAHDTFFRDWTLNGEKDTQQVTRYLSEIQKRYGTVTAFFVSDKTRNYYHTDGIIKQVSPDDPDDSWYFHSRDMKEPYEINVDHDTADRSRLTIFVNYQVRDYEGKVIGVTGVGLAVNSVTNLIETYQKRYGRTIYFSDRQGNITLHGSDFGDDKTLQAHESISPLATQILTSPGTSLSYNDGNETIFVNSRLVPEFNWLLLVEQHEHIGDQRIENTLLINIAISLFITLLVGFTAYFTIRSYQKRLEELASFDKLTSACNRQVFDLVFEKVTKACRRRKEPLAMICLDLDQFKEINDTYGHPGGDTALREVASMIRSQISDEDTLCRWGGDEFVILLPGRDRSNAMQVARRIADMIRQNGVRFGRENISLTISAGVTEYRDSEILSSIINRVDQALYSSKNAGRDQISQA
ncbi:diguanylate cyclase [Thalassospira profundimaris]|uniref:diguanylate cyclase n=1 Tax=Thalassospira profundimaris TaxID=502049 RepID=A0A367WKG9_9PROT|nr:sensor domain-containing diguanylate cyclase [Thalassospira profundimaris]RCK41924.1 diguanylate cyclase [Thalassospira profundimaris]